MNPTPTPLPASYRAEVLDLFRRQKYADALPRFADLLRHPRFEKDEAALRANTLICMGSLARDGGEPAWSDVADHATRYACLLGVEAAARWPVPPAAQAFDALIDLADRLCPRAEPWIRSFRARVPARFEGALLDAVRHAAERAAMDYARPGHAEAALTLGMLFLDLAADRPASRADRVALRTRLAELLAFRATALPSAAPMQALGLLEAALEEAPQDTFANALRAHLVQRGQVVEQIRRFEHDARSRLGGVLAALGRIRNAEGLPDRLRRDFLAVERNLVALEAVNRVVMGQQGADFRDVDPADLCRDALQEHGLPCGGVEPEGVPRTWSVDVGYVRLALDNLVINALEAYRRRGLDLPERPVRMVVRYVSGTIEVADRAGGLSGTLPDPFLPYVSEKGVHQGAGLGLSQARRAMELQDGSLEPGGAPPADGAAFVLSFLQHGHQERER